MHPDKETLPLIGAKEGIGHAALCFIEPGDIALVPDPGYPVYSVGTWFAGGECHWMPLLEENGWMPDLDAIPDDVADKAKVIWLNYPNNPTGAIADAGYFAKVVEFAKAHDIAVMHDASYSEVAFDGYRPISFLETPGAIDVGVEFHSLSKSYNMTGWRLGMVVGNEDIISALMVIKSNLDSGVPNAIQYMGMEAMEMSQDAIDERNAIYEHRRDRVVQTLREHRTGRHSAQGKPLCVDAHTGGLHIRGVHGAAAGRGGHRGNARQRLRGVRRGLHKALADHQ